MGALILALLGLAFGSANSRTRKESDLQQIEKRLAKRDEEEKKYPWLYN